MFKIIEKAESYGKRLDEKIEANKLTSESQSHFCLYYILNQISFEMCFSVGTMLGFIFAAIVLIGLISFFPWLLIVIAVALGWAIKQHCNKNWKKHNAKQ